MVYRVRRGYAKTNIGIFGANRNTVKIANHANGSTYGHISIKRQFRPTGWLILGIGAAAAAFTAFKEEGEKARQTLADFRAEVNGFNIDQAKEELAKLEQEFNDFKSTVQYKGVAETMFDVEEITPAMRAYANQMDKDFNIVETRIKDYESRIKAIRDRINALTTGAGTGGGEDTPGGAAGGKWIDKFIPFTPENIERIQAGADETLKAVSYYFKELGDISTDFRVLSLQNIEAEYLIKKKSILSYRRL